MSVWQGAMPETSGNGLKRVFQGWSTHQGRIIQGKMGIILPGNGATHRERKKTEGRKEEMGKKGRGKEKKERQLEAKSLMVIVCLCSISVEGVIRG
jgi:hypothetical protein